MTASASLPQIAVIVGSNRRDSLNRKLAEALAKLAAGKFEPKFVRIDDLPMYNQDHEGNLATQVVRFKDELAKADGVLIVTPEHNRSIPTVLKNAVDWGTRPWGKNNWAGKPIAIAGTSPGALGAALAQSHLRQVLSGSLSAFLFGGEIYITYKEGLIDDQGNVADEGTKKFLQGFVDGFVAFVTRHAPAAQRSAA
jgi:chromate reductase, NAD(P)H dehydrogenase (quinone)